MISDRPVYRQTDWQQAAATARWLENSGPTYEYRDLVVTSELLGSLDSGTGQVSYASLWLIRQTPIGDSVAVKVRVK